MAPATIDVHRSFADYGLDSILGIELTHKPRLELAIDVDVTRLFDFSTVAQLERFLEPHFVAVPSQPVVEVTRPAPAPAPAGQREPIAIVGMSGRFARSENVEQLWDHLVNGRDLVEAVSRFDLGPYYKDAAPGSYCRHGSFIEGVDRFDPVFFGISGVEATYMDPQQRLFLEEAWKALENAGHAGAAIGGQAVWRVRGLQRGRLPGAVPDRAAGTGVLGQHEFAGAGADRVLPGSERAGDRGRYRVFEFAGGDASGVPEPVER